jgi:hypothetical protein
LKKSVGVPSEVKRKIRVLAGALSEIIITIAHTEKKSRKVVILNQFF